MNRYNAAMRFARPCTKVTVCPRQKLSGRRFQSAVLVEMHGGILSDCYLPKSSLVDARTGQNVIVGCHVIV